MVLAKRIMSFFLSLKTALWLLCALIALLFAGAFVMPAHQEFQTIHSIPLLRWMQDHPPGLTWWLWASVAALVVLAANTLFCSVESVLKKRKVTQWLLLISPQVIHAGFLFILLAHLLSSLGGFKGMAVAAEGTMLRMPDTSDAEALRVTAIDLALEPNGYLADWAVSIEYVRDGVVIAQDRLQPNKPSLYKGLNINVKDLQAFPYRAVLLELSREPGAVWALVGGILFMAGTVTLIALKWKRAEEGSR